jgi:hypothetical protein
VLFIVISTLHAAELPRVKMENGGSQLIINGQPFLILGGELGNSSAGTAAQADSIIPGLANMHVNTILVPVAWEQIEPKEGSFDFSILDHWIETARQHNVHLVPLWFGSWKNALSNYAPSPGLTNLGPRSKRTSLLLGLRTRSSHPPVGVDGPHISKP